MNSNICHDTLVGIPEYLHKHQDVLLSIAELPTFYIAKVRFSRFLSHPFWCKSHFFHKRKDEFEHLSRYPCWHTRVPSQTPGRVALHRRTSYILHCKKAIFMIFEPSLLIQKSFFSQKKRWIRKSVTIHLLVYKSTFKNTRTSCSPSQNFLHFTLQSCDFPDFWAIAFDTKVIFPQKKRWIPKSVTIHLLAYQSSFTNTRTSCSPSQNFLHFTLQSCDFPDFWAIPFDTKFNFFTKEKMNSNICHDTLVGIPEYLHKHQDVLLSIAELPTFYIAKLRFSRFLSHPFWCKSHFFHKRKDEFEHLSRYPCWHTRVPSQTPGRVALHRRTSYILHCKVAIFPIFEPSLLVQKSFFHKRKDEFEHLSRYPCWHTRVPSQTPGRVALHRRTSYVLHCKSGIFPIFEPSLLVQKSFFSQKKRWIRTFVTIPMLAYQSTFTNTRTCCSPSQNFLHFTLQSCDFPDFWAIAFDTKVIFPQKKRWIPKSVTIHLLAYQSTFKNTRTSCSPSQNFLHFTLQSCDFPDFWAIPFDTKFIFFTKEKMNSNICHDTLVGIPEYLHKHQDVLLSIAELPTFYIAKLRFPPLFEPSLLVQKSFFSQKKRWIRTSVTIPMLAYQSTFTNTRTCCSPSQNFLHFTLQSCDFPDFWAIPFGAKVIFFTKEKMNSNICHDTHVGIPEYLHKHQDVLLSIAELPTFYIAKVRFSRFLSHPFWCKSHFFHKRKDEFEHLSWYPCWHTRVPSQTPGRVALHRKTSYILHCKDAIFPIFKPSLLIQKSFFSQKKRWIPKSATIHLLAYQSTFTNTRTSCSPSQNFLHFTLQRCDFPDFCAILFDTKVIFFTKEKMNSKICYYTFVGIPEYLQKHKDVLLSIAELPTFYIANLRFSRFLSHPFWYKIHFFHKRKDEFEHLSRYTCWHTRVPSQTPGRLALHRRTSYILHCKVAIFPIFEPSLFIQNSFFFTKEKMNSNICHDTLVGIPEYLHKHQDVLLSIAELPTFYIAKVRFSRFLSHPFWCKSHFFHKRKDEFEHLSRYPCWHTRVPSQTPGRVALHRRTSYILHCKGAIFPIFAPSFLTQKSFFSQKKRWIRTSVTIHLLAYQSTFTNTRTSCSPSQNFLHFTLQSCDFPDFWAIPFYTKFIFFHKRKDEFEHLSRYTCWHTRVPSQTPGRDKHQLSIAELPTFYIAKVRFSRFLSHPFWCKSHFFTKEKMNSNICHDTHVGIPEYLHRHQDVLLSIAELPTFYIAKVRFSRFLSHPFWCKSHFFHKRKDEFEHLSRYPCWHTRVPSQTARTCCSPSQNFLRFTLQKCDFPDFWAIPFGAKVIFFTKEKMNSNICHDTHVGIWYKIHFFHKRVPSQTPGRVALHRRTSYILHCKVAIFPIFEPSLLIQKFIFFTKEKMNSNICHDTLVGIPEYLHKHQDVLLSIAELPTFYIAKLRFSRFLSHPFWCKSHFFHKRKDEFEHLSRYLLGIPENLHKHQDVLLSIAELPTFYIAKLRFSRFLSHPFWYKIHFFHKRKDVRTSVTIHFLAYQITFTNTRTSCSPSQNFLHFTLQSCDFPDFWAIPFVTKFIFFTK